MKPDYDVERLDDLIRLLLDEALPEKERAELGELLRGSRQARDHYRTSLRIHAALIRHPRTGVVEERRGVISWKRWISGGIAACLCLGLWLAWAGKEPEAWLSGERGAVWSREVERDVAGRTMELRYGFAEVSFRNGVKVTLEGPCRFEVVDVSRMKVMSGKVSVKAPEKKPAGFAFHLDTPGGRLTDLGTEFGVSVGSGAEGAVVLTEVFDGEIEVPGSDGARKRMRAGDAAAIVKESGGTKLVTEPDDGPVDLGNVARKLPENVMRTDFPGNLALGKPVTTPAYLNKARGSVFPPDNLTDG